MSRTRKGSKAPGWEPRSNRHQKAEQRADYREFGDDDDWAYMKELEEAWYCYTSGPCPSCLASFGDDDE